MGGQEGGEKESNVSLIELEDTARYAGLLLAPALFLMLWLIFGNFWCPVVTSVTLSSNLSNFERNPPPKKNQKVSKN